MVTILVLGFISGFALGCAWMRHLEHVREQQALHDRLWATLKVHERTGSGIYVDEDPSDYIPLATFTRN